MADEPDIPAHLYRALHGRLRNNDRDGAIQLYYELLSSGRSVGEILHEGGPIRGNSEYCGAAAAEQPRSDPGQAAVPVVSEPAGIAQANAPGPNSPGAFDESGRHSTGRPPEIRSAPLGKAEVDDREQRFRPKPPGFAPNIAGAAGAQASRGREAAAEFDGRERFWSRRFPSIATSIAFWALYTGAVASASIAGFSILRGTRNTEPAITGVPPRSSPGTEAIAMPNATPDPSGKTVAAVKPHAQAGDAGAAQASEPARRGEPNPTTLPGPAEPIPVGARSTAAAVRQEAEAPQQPDAGRTEAFEQLIEQLANSTTAHEPAASVEPSPAAAPIGAIATEPHPNADQPQTGETPQSAARDETGAAAAASGAVPAALAPQAQTAEKPAARAPRRSAGSQHSASRRVAARRPQPAYAGRGPAANLAAQGAVSYSGESARGYGYGVYGPSPYSETGD